MELTQDQVRAFAGPNADYYIERWHRVRPEGGSQGLGFNWPAFFFTVSWLLYRRMYRWFGITLAVWLGSGVVVVIVLAAAIQIQAWPLAFAMTLLLLILPFFFQVMFGIYGSYWYYLHAQRQISRLTPAGQADLAAVGRMGGTDLRAAVASAVVLGFIAIWAESQAPRHRVHPTTRPHLSQQLAPRQFPWLLTDMGSQA
jgi:uncharacterized protein DUF2628